MLRKYLLKSYDRAVSMNMSNILSMIEEATDQKLCDIGCADGSWTIELQKKLGSRHIYGLEITAEDVKKAARKGIEASHADLTKTWPFPDGFFDIVHANQVIEHLCDTDKLVEETLRVLKPGGYAIISTENLSSWHNIFPLVFGWQPFSMANISRKGAIGNPFSLWSTAHGEEQAGQSWQHLRVFSYGALRDLFQRYGFITEKIMAAGYYPLPAGVARLDPRHSHLIAMKFRKPVMRQQQ